MASQRGPGPTDARSVIIESCNSLWIFQPERMRFRRVFKGHPDGAPAATEWQDYHGVEHNRGTGSFAVMLDEHGTRWLRSWYHTTDCAQCGGQVTGELSLERIAEHGRGPATLDPPVPDGYEVGAELSEDAQAFLDLVRHFEHEG